MGTKIKVKQIEATGTPSSTTFLRGDGQWETPSGGGGYDRWITGQNFVSSQRIVLQQMTTTALVTLAMSTNRIYYMPFQVSRDVTLTTLGFNRTTTTAGGVVCGIYSDNNNRPGTKLVQNTNETTTTAGHYESPVSISLTKGTKYWAAVGTSGGVTLRASNAGLPVLGFVQNSTLSVSHYYETFTHTGTLPNTAGTLTNGGSTSPAVYANI